MGLSNHRAAMFAKNQDDKSRAFSRSGPDRGRVLDVGSMEDSLSGRVIGALEVKGERWHAGPVVHRMCQGYSSAAGNAAVTEEAQDMRGRPPGANPAAAVARQAPKRCIRRAGAHPVRGSALAQGGLRA